MRALEESRQRSREAFIRAMGYATLRLSAMSGGRRLSEFPTSEEMGFPEGTVLALPADKGQVLYRLLRSEAPEASDFLSFREMGRPTLEGVPEIIQRGVSMFATPEQAFERARRYPKLVARVTMWHGLGINLARTFTSPGHYTVWGDAEVLAGRARLDRRVDAP